MIGIRANGDAVQGWRMARIVAALTTITGLAACATTPTAPTIPVTQEAAQYRSHAKSHYAEPGTADDPWGPYIEEASRRFDVPDPWIRAVMQQESGGRLFASDGSFVTSVPGAMGLMQLMPPTYDDMKQQYGLGDDAYDPHDNIIAGTAYIRQMYDIYGSPGFLAAYNDGPGSLDRYLRSGRALPRETRRYVASIGPQIVGIWPNSRSAADLMVAQHDAARGTQYAAAQSTDQTRSIRSAWAHHAAPADGADQDDEPVQVAEAPVAATTAPAYTHSWNAMSPQNGSPNSVSAAWAARGTPAASPTPQTTPDPDSVRSHWAARVPAPAQAAPSEDTSSDATPVATTPVAMVPARSRYAFHLVTPAMAEPSPLLRHPTQTATASHHGDWSIQVGAFNSAAQASQAAGHANASLSLVSARSQIAPVKSGRARLYRARLTGLSHDDAIAACHRLGHAGPCVIVSPSSSF